MVDPTLYQLCQAQINLLVQSLGVTAGGVYWAESGGENPSPRWTPISVYPDRARDRGLPALGQTLSSPEGPEVYEAQEVPLEGEWAPVSFEVEPGEINQEIIDGILDDLHEDGAVDGLSFNTPKRNIPWMPYGESIAADPQELGNYPGALQEPWEGQSGQSQQSQPSQDQPSQGQQNTPAAGAADLGALMPLTTFGDRGEVPQNYPLWRPLTSEGTVLGLLVLERLQGPWSLGEQEQVAEVVTTLEAAFTLARRQQWLEETFAQQERFYETQRDRLHDLLHQFKNPLTAIRTFGKLLLRRFEGDERATTVAGQVLRESDRLQGMLNNFGEVVDLEPMDVPPATPEPAASPPPLLLPGGEDKSVGGAGDDASDAPGALDASTVRPLALLPTAKDNRPVVLGELLTQVVETAQLLAQEAQVELEVLPWGALPAVAGDRTTLQEIIGNVVDNALKYTPRGGRVQIQASVGVPYCFQGLVEGDESPSDGDELALIHQWNQGAGLEAMPGAVEDALLQRSPNSPYPAAGRYVALMVQDSGLGISAADLQQLFARRFRGDKGNSEIPGTGLGLAIVRDTLVALGGAVDVFSPAIALEAVGSSSDDGPPTLAPIASEAITAGTSVVLWIPLLDPTP